MFKMTGNVFPALYTECVHFFLQFTEIRSNFVITLLFGNNKPVCSNRAAKTEKRPDCFAKTILFINLGRHDKYDAIHCVYRFYMPVNKNHTAAIFGNLLGNCI